MFWPAKRTGMFWPDRAVWAKRTGKEAGQKGQARIGLVGQNGRNGREWPKRTGRKRPRRADSIPLGRSRKFARPTIHLSSKASARLNFPMKRVALFVWILACVPQVPNVFQAGCLSQIPCNLQAPCEFKASSVRQFDFVSQIDRAEKTWVELLPSRTRASVLWSADHEEGTLFDWEYDGNSDNNGGGLFTTGKPGEATAQLDSGIVLSGKYSVKTTIRNAIGSRNGPKAVRLLRWTDRPWDQGGKFFPQSAYYGVWFRIDHAFELQNPTQGNGGWWNVFQFKSEDTHGDSQPVWVLNIGNTGRDGKLHFYLYSNQKRASLIFAVRTDADPNWSLVPSRSILSAIKWRRRGWDDRDLARRSTNPQGRKYENETGEQAVLGCRELHRSHRRRRPSW